jgi:hypothetical protein
MMGFKSLSDKEKKRLLPVASDAVQAMHKADMGQGLPLKKEQVGLPPRVTDPSTPDGSGRPAVRLVVPGPNHASAEVIVKQNAEDGKFGLYALRDFASGERVYEFWCQIWPIWDDDGDTELPIDMVFACKLTEGDPPEGTVVRVDPLECGASRDREGRLMFSVWDLLTAHSCEPNLVYDDEDEGEDWHSAYAARDIKAGERLTIDYNSILWDRSDCSNKEEIDQCHCGAAKCTGTRKGFKFLPQEAKEERKLMSWNRLSPPYKGENGKVTPGDALSPHVRVCWREDVNLRDYAPDTGSSSESSSSDESSDEDGCCSRFRRWKY